MSKNTQIQVIQSKKRTSVCIRTETSPLYSSLYLFPDEAIRIGLELIQHALQIVPKNTRENSSLDLLDISSILTTLSLQAKQTEKKLKSSSDTQT